MPLDLADESERHGRWRDTSPVWTADAVPLPIRIDEPGARRPVCVLVADQWVILHQDMLGSLGGEADEVADALSAGVRGAIASVRRPPEVVQVRHADVGMALVPLMNDIGLRVSIELDPPGIEDVVRSLVEALGGHPIWPPIGRSETWRGWNLPKALLDHLFDAAAEFYEQAPWRHLSNLQAPRATFPSGREWSACVLGGAGEAYGLALYTSAEDLFASMTCDTPEEAFEGIRGRMVSIGYEPLKSVSDEARRELSLARWKLAGPAAYPDLMTSNTPGGGVAREDVRDLTALLRALPRFATLHAAALIEEERTGSPCVPIEWTDPESGAVLRYRGEATTAPLGVDEDESSDPVRVLIHGALEQAEEELGPDAPEHELLARANELLDARFGAYNATAQAGLGDLSPEQAHRLLISDWDGSGAVRLRRDLSADELRGAPILTLARALLELASEPDGLGRTQAGYVKVAAVRRLVDRAGVDDARRPLGAEGKEPRLRELDVWPVHEARILAGLAGLIRPRRTRFEMTREGRRLLAPGSEGELFALLFESCWRRFNVFYGGYAEWPELQHQIAFTLYRLGREATDWRNPGDLLALSVLPFAIDHAPELSFASDPSWLLERHVLSRLTDFGLLERRQRGRARDSREFRLTPLFGTFLGFDLSSLSAPRNHA